MGVVGGSPGARARSWGSSISPNTGPARGVVRVWRAGAPPARASHNPVTWGLGWCMLPGMAVGPFYQLTPPGGSFIPPSEAMAEWRALDSLTSPVAKQWVLSPRPQPLGSWARLRNTVYESYATGLVLFRAGTLVRLTSRVKDSLGRKVHIDAGGIRTTVMFLALEPAEPPPTALERLVGPDVPWGG